MFWLAIPDSIVEGTNLIKSAKRSVYLTSGYRLQIFITIITLFIIRFQLDILSDYQNGHSFIISLSAFMVGSFIVLILGVLCTVFYHDVRIIKEGAAQIHAQRRISRRMQTGAELPPIS